MEKLVPSAVGDRAVQEVLLPNELGNLTCYGVFTLANLAKKNRKNVTQVVCASGSMRCTQGKDAMKPILLGQFSKITLAGNVVTFYKIRFSDRQEEKPSEVEAYQLTGTDLSLTPLIAEKGKIAQNPQLITLLYDSICIQQKLHGAHLSCHTFRAATLPWTTVPKLKCSERSCTNKLDQSKPYTFFCCEVCSAVVHTNCCAEFIASNPITVGAENSDDCLSTLRKKPADELEKRLVSILTNIHRCNSDLITKGHVDLALYLTSKLTFYTAPVGSGNRPLTYHEEATKKWVTKNQAYDKLVLLFQNMFTGISVLQMNSVESEPSLLDYVFRIVCETNLASADDFQRVKSALLILSSLDQRRSYHGFQNSKYDHNKSKFMDLGVKQMKANYNDNFWKNDGFLIPLLILKVIPERFPSHTIGQHYFKNIYNGVGEIGLLAASKLEKFQQEIGSLIQDETLRASVYYNLAKIIHYSARFLIHHSASDNLEEMLFLEHISLFEEAEKLGFSIIESQFIKEIGPSSSNFDKGVRVVRDLNTSANESKARVKLCEGILNNNSHALLVQKKPQGSELFIAKICSENFFCCKFIGVDQSLTAFYLKHYENYSIYHVIMRHLRERMMNKLMTFVDSEVSALPTYHRQLFKYRLYLLLDRLFPLVANSDKSPEAEAENLAKLKAISDETEKTKEIPMGVYTRCYDILTGLTQEFGDFFAEEKIKSPNYFTTTLPQVIGPYEKLTTLALGNALMINIALDAARGLQFLHSKNIPHKNISPHCVVLDSHYKGFLTGFDKTTVKSSLDSEPTEHRIESTRIAAFAKSSKTLKDDIASLGLVLWQMWNLNFAGEFKPEYKERNENGELMIPALKQLIEGMCNRDYAVRPNIDTVISALFAILDKKQYFLFAPVSGGSSHREKATLSESSSIQHQPPHQQKFTPEYFLAKINTIYDHHPLSDAIPYSQRYLLVPEPVWRRIMTLLDASEKQGDVGASPSSLLSGSGKSSKTSSRALCVALCWREFKKSSSKVSSKSAKSKRPQGTLYAGLALTNSGLALATKPGECAESSTTTASSTSPLHAKSSSSKAKSGLHSATQDSLSHNSGASTPERERKSGPSVPVRPGLPAPFAGSNAGTGALLEEGSERVDLRVVFEYEMKHAFSQLGAESDDFVEWKVTILPHDPDYRIRRAKFDFGKIITHPAVEVNGSPFTAPILSETQKPLVTCCVPIQVHMAVTFEDEPLTKDHTFVAVFELPKKEVREKKGAIERSIAIYYVPSGPQPSSPTSVQPHSQQSSVPFLNRGSRGPK